MFLKPSGYTGAKPRGGKPGTNGLLFDWQGRLICASTATGDRTAQDGQKDVRDLADKIHGQTPQQPQRRRVQIQRRSLFHRSALRTEGLKDDPAKELTFNGVYRLAKDGTLTLLDQGDDIPNGIGFSPDEKTLYVANPIRSRRSGGRFTSRPTAPSARAAYSPTVAVGGGGKGHARRHEGGPQRQRVRHRSRRRAGLRPGRHAPGHDRHRQATANCGWGEDGTVLYITADMYLWRDQATPRDSAFSFASLLHAT